MYTCWTLRTKKIEPSITFPTSYYFNNSLVRIDPIDSIRNKRYVVRHW
jgi:hypothetical protein